MANHRHIFCSSLVGTVILLSLLSPLSTVAEIYGDCGGSKCEDDGKDNFIENTPITWKYGLMWTRSSLQTTRYDFSNFNDDIESVNCTTDENCTAALPGVEAALEYDTDIPSSPYCVLPDDEANATTPGYGIIKCTCGEGRCVSYSRESGSGNPFYYCGPCGYVGAKCYKERCTHELAECRGGYCECIQEGTFYDMSYCYIPFYGQDLIINILIATCILLLCCATVAYGYHKLGNRRLRRGSFYSERGSSTGRRESPSDDTPPAYDDVMEKLPSYQDAIQMVEKGHTETGLNNPAFEEDETSTQKSKIDQDSITKANATPPGDAEGQNNAGFEKDEARSQEYLDTTSTIQIKSMALSSLNKVNPSTSPTLNTDTENFPESSTREGSDSRLPVMDEQQRLGIQPIELKLFDTLNTQQTTTSV